MAVKYKLLRSLPSGETDLGWALYSDQEVAEEKGAEWLKTHSDDIVMLLTIGIWEPDEPWAYSLLDDIYRKESDAGNATPPPAEGG